MLAYIKVNCGAEWQLKDFSEDNGVTWLHLEGIPTSIGYPVQWREQRELPERDASRETPVLEDRLDGTRWRWSGEDGNYPWEAALWATVHGAG